MSVERSNLAQGLYDPAFEHDACGVGFIADLTGKKTHRIVEDALKILVNMTHRGAVGADPLAGDGAGLLIQIPHELLGAECAKLGFTLPEPGQYAVGQMFLPKERATRIHCEEVVRRVILQEGQVCLGWRDVPVEPAACRPSCSRRSPCTVRCSSAAARASRTRWPSSASCPDPQGDLERHLRRDAGPRHRLHPVSRRAGPSSTKACSCRISSAPTTRTSPTSGSPRRWRSSTALLDEHLPSWKLAHPYRMVARNGEINTLRGNVNWMAREPGLRLLAFFGKDISRLWPVSYEGDRTRPASTTRSSSSSWAATAWPMPR